MLFQITIKTKETYFFCLFYLKSLNVISNGCSFTKTGVNKKQRSQHPHSLPNYFNYHLLKWARMPSTSARHILRAEISQRELVGELVHIYAFSWGKILSLPLVPKETYQGEGNHQNLQGLLLHLTFPNPER